MSGAMAIRPEILMVGRCALIRVLVAGTLAAARAGAQIPMVTPIEGVTGMIDQILNFDTGVLLTGPGGAYAYDGTSVRALLSGNDNDVSFAKESDGWIWLGSSSGTYAFDGRELRTVKLLDSHVRQVIEADGSLWIKTVGTLYRLKDGHEAVPCFSIDARLRETYETGLGFFIATDDGLYVSSASRDGLDMVDFPRPQDSYRFGSARSFRTSGLVVDEDRVLVLGGYSDVGPMSLYAIESSGAVVLEVLRPGDDAELVRVDNQVWVITDEWAGLVRRDGVHELQDSAGLTRFDLNREYGATVPRIVGEKNGADYLVTRDAVRVIRDTGTAVILDATPVVADSGVIRMTLTVEGNTWVATDAGLHVLRDGQLVASNPAITGVVSLTAVGSNAWVVCEKGTYLALPAAIVPVDVISLAPRQVVETGGRSWVSTNFGLYAVAGGHARLVTTPVFIDALAVLQTEVWAVAGSEIFKISGEQIDCRFAVAGKVHQLVPYGNELWAVADDGVRRLRRDDGFPDRVFMGSSPHLFVGGQSLWLVADNSVARIVGDERLGVDLPDLSILDVADCGSGFVVRTAGGSYWSSRADPGNVIPLDYRMTIEGSVQTGSTTWIAASGGLLRVEGGRVETLLAGKPIHDVRTFDGNVWAVGRAIYRIGADGDIDEFSVDEWSGAEAEAVVESGGELLAVYPHSVVAFGRSGTRRLLSAGYRGVQSFAAGGSYYVAAEDGLYSIDKNGLKLAMPGAFKEPTGRTLCGWTIVNGDSGLYLVGDTILHVLADEQESVEPCGWWWGQVPGWIEADHDLAVVDASGVRTLPRPLSNSVDNRYKRSCGRCFFQGDEVLYLSGTDLFLCDSGSARRIGDDEVWVSEAAEAHGTWWLATPQGLCKLDAAGARLIPEDGLSSVNDVAVINDQLWCATSDEVLRFDEKANHFIKESKTNFHGYGLPPLREAISIGGVAALIEKDRSLTWLQPGDVTSSSLSPRCWAQTRYGLILADGAEAYRVDEKRALIVDLGLASSWWEQIASWLMGTDVHLAGVIQPALRVREDGRIIGTAEWEREEYSIIVELDHETFLQEVAGDRYSPITSFERRLPPGRHDVWVSVRAKRGPTHSFMRSIIALPGSVTLGLLIFAGWCLLIVLLIGLGPYNRLCWNVAMSSALRDISTLGLVRLLTELPMVKHHLLKRYLRGLASDRQLRDHAEGFVCPSGDLEAGVFLQQLREHRSVFVHGPSGVGKTAYLKYLTMEIAAGHARRWSSPRLVPFFVEVRKYEADAPIDMLVQQLERFGDVTDAGLARRLVDSEGVVMLFDGLNEVSPAVVQKIARVAERYSKNALVVASSQVLSDAFESATRLSYGPLSDKAAKELFQRLGHDLDQATFEALTQQQLQVYSLPQDLRMGVEVVRSGRPLPGTRRSLYEEIIDNAFVADTGEDESNLHGLQALAFGLMKERRSLFQLQAGDLPDTVVRWLLDRKLIMRRGDLSSFRHELIRDFLASRHLAVHWRREFGAVETIPASWASVLEFVSDGIDDAREARDFLIAACERNEDLSLHLFQRLKVARPAVVAGWEQKYRDTYMERRMRTMLAARQ